MKVDVEEVLEEGRKQNPKKCERERQKQRRVILITRGEIVTLFLVPHRWMDGMAVAWPGGICRIWS